MARRRGGERRRFARVAGEVEVTCTPREAGPDAVETRALNFSAGPDSAPLTAPQMGEHTAELSKTTKKLRAADLKKMMALSDSLAQLNRERFQAFDPESEDGLQAAFAFNGDVYLGLKARELDKKALAWAQDRVRILSGLYGVLRPMDAIQPYRLEMGVRIKTKLFKPETSARARLVRSVSIQPGSTELTWMLSLAQAVASARLSCTMPPLEAA